MVLMAWVTLDAGLQGETPGTEEGPGHSTGPAAVRVCPRAGGTGTHTVIIYRLAQARLTHLVTCFMKGLSNGSVLHTHPQKITFWPKVLAHLKKKSKYSPIQTF